MSMALRSGLLTVRIHRFEVVLSVAAMAVIIIAIVVSIARMQGAAIPAGCVREGDPECSDAFAAFWAVMAESDWLRGLTPTLLPVAIGLLLGGPIVARELELGTTWLAWSLSARRTAWLVQRLLPMLLLLLAGLAVIAVLETELHDATHIKAILPSFDDLGVQGPTLLAHGFMTFTIAAFIGAIAGRTLTTFVLSGLLAIGLVVVGSSSLQDRVAEELAEWQTEPYIAESGEFLTLPALWFDELWYEYDGQRYDDETLYDALAPVGDFDEWMADNVVRVRRVLPVEAYGTIEQAQVGAATLIGLLALGGVFLVVTRRRPT